MPLARSTTSTRTKSRLFIISSQGSFTRSILSYTRTSHSLGWSWWATSTSCQLCWRSTNTGMSTSSWSVTCSDSLVKICRKKGWMNTHLAKSSTRESLGSSSFLSTTSLISSQLFHCNSRSTFLTSTFRSKTSCCLHTPKTSSSDRRKPSQTVISCRRNPTFPICPSITAWSSTSKSTTSSSRSSRTTTKPSSRSFKVSLPFIQPKTMKPCRSLFSTSHGLKSASSVSPTVASCSQYCFIYSGHRDIPRGRTERKADKVRAEPDQIPEHHHLLLHRLRDHACLQEHPRKDQKLASEQDVRAHQRRVGTPMGHALPGQPVPNPEKRVDQAADSQGDTQQTMISHISINIISYEGSKNRHTHWSQDAQPQVQEESSLITPATLDYPCLARGQEVAHTWEDRVPSELWAICQWLGIRLGLFR